MNLIREYLGSVAGVQIFAVVSLLIFLLAFAFLLVETFRIKRERIKEYGNLPLEEDKCESNNQ